MSVCYTEKYALLYFICWCCCCVSQSSLSVQTDGNVLWQPPPRPKITNPGLRSSPRSGGHLQPPLWEHHGVSPSQRDVVQQPGQRGAAHLQHPRSPDLWPAHTDPCHPRSGLSERPADCPAQLRPAGTRRAAKSLGFDLHCHRGLGCHPSAVQREAEQRIRRYAAQRTKLWPAGEQLVQQHHLLFTQVS